MEKYTAVIQAGGMGTRMHPLTQDKLPKPMIILNGKPMLQWQIEELAENGFQEIVIIVGHLGKQIEEFFQTGEEFKVHISYIHETEPLGSAGALYYLRGKLKTENIALVFGDVMFSLDWERIMRFHEAHGKAATLLAHPNSHPYDSDLLLVDDQNVVIGLDSKNNKRSYWYANCVNAGLYVLSDKILQNICAPVKTDLENDILAPLFAERQICAYRTSEYVKDAGTPERFRQAEKEKQNGVWMKKCLKNKQRCIFLDRDGTINQYRGLIAEEKDFELEEKAAAAIRKINESGYLAIVVTNQPVVARGMCTEETVRLIHKKMETLLGEEGAYLDDIVFCPHHPDRGYPEENPLYKIKCRCRKPDIGMIEQMVKKYNIDLEHSWMIGDSTVDIQTAHNAGLRSVILNTGQAGRDGKYNVEADIYADDLLQAVEVILGQAGEG